MRRLQPVRRARRERCCRACRITADTVNNTLLIYASQENYRIIERTLVQLDRQQLQVAIEATVAEVTLNDTLNTGCSSISPARTSASARTMARS